MKYSLLIVVLLSCIYLSTAIHPPQPNPAFLHPQLQFAQHTGYVLVNETYDANLFYWMFESQSDPSRDPVILWMTGGPGCSSELAVLFENGPYTVGPNNNLVPNPYSWNKRSNIIYIDQPAGTGFSYTSKYYVRDEKQVGVEMLTFLKTFFQRHPQFLSNDFYVIGESYGGHFVPTTAYYLLKSLQETSPPPQLLPTHFKGIALGNGWVDPYHQYASYGPFAYSNNLIPLNVYDQINSSVEICQQLLREKKFTQAYTVCASIMSQVLQYAGNLNVYDIKLQCNPQPLCYNFTDITNYLRTPSVLKELNVSSRSSKYEICNFNVNGMFGVDVEESFAWELPFVLEKGLRVVVYSGDLDLICNWFGGRMWTDELKWSGQKGFREAGMRKWKNLGEVKSFEGMSFVRVFNAGHMVPHDQPVAALEIADNLIYNRPF